MDYADLSAMILAAGALGTASFGIVEALKHTRLGLMGFEKIVATLKPALLEAVERAYGSDSIALLRAQYRQGRGKGGLGKTLRQGLRIGLSSDNARKLAEAIGVVDPEKLEEVAAKLESGGTLDDKQRGLLARFELAADARIDAALALSQSSYVGSMRVAASGIAIILAFIGAATLTGGISKNWGNALIVGIASVPLAPIAKDVVKGLTQARKAMGARK